MKRILAICLMMGMVLVFSGCGSKDAGLYQPKKDAVIALEEFAEEFAIAQTNEEIANALNTYADKMDKIRPRFIKMKKDPAYDVNEMPLYLKNRESKAMNKYVEHNDKVKLNMDDPGIREAYQRFVDHTSLQDEKYASDESEE